MNNQAIQLKADAQGDLRLLQITDTHLFSQKDRDLLGIKTMSSFEAVVKHASKYISECQAVLSTGDLSQDHSDQSYISFADCIKRLALPCYTLPGNHDLQSVMQPNLQNNGLADIHHIISDYWQIIMLDSQAEGFVYGELKEEQLDFLHSSLAQYPDKYALICLHHHVLPVGSAWLDQHILKNSERFLGVIAPFANVRVVLSGHVHQESNILHNGVQLLTTPSTCVQFKPSSFNFTVDDLPPGYRYLSLNKSGEITTYIERITSEDFMVDSKAQGY